jgi:uncharacterized protein
METSFFLDKEGHLRSGWRLGGFLVAFTALVTLLRALLFFFLALALKGSPDEALSGNWGFVAQAGILFSSATLAGWGCGAVFEELPFHALGWTGHKGWLRNFALGSAIGAGSLLLATLLATATRGFHFNLNGAVATSSIGRTLTLSAFVFVFAAAAEEVLFRGYPLQTFTRANLAWLGITLTSASFAASHLRNPNVAGAFTLINTTIAGVWLGIAYLRTRSLWLPLGLHWSWNWTMGSVMGLPVSGINSVAPAPLLHAVNAGPDWITGGAYGIEGGAACTLALLVSIAFVWRTGAR